MSRPGSCVAIALANIFGIDPLILINEYQCDKIIAPDQQKPFCYKGMNPAEVSWECLKRGFMCTEFPIQVTTYPTFITYQAPYKLDADFLKDRNGLLYGHNHCVALKDGKIIDGTTYLPLVFQDDGEIEGYYMFVLIHSINHQS